MCCFSGLHYCSLLTPGNEPSPKYPCYIKCAYLFRFYLPFYVPTTEQERWEIMKSRMERAKMSGDIYLTDGWLHLGNSNMWTRWWTGRETGLCWWIGWQWGSLLHQKALFYLISWWIVARSLSVFDLLWAINDCLNSKRIFEYRFYFETFKINGLWRNNCCWHHLIKTSMYCVAELSAKVSMLTCELQHVLSHNTTL